MLHVLFICSDSNSFNLFSSSVIIAPLLNCPLHHMKNSLFHIFLLLQIVLLGSFLYIFPGVHNAAIILGYIIKSGFAVLQIAAYLSVTAIHK